MDKVLDSVSYLDKEDQRKQNELKLQRRIVFGITPSEKDRIDNNIETELSEGLRKKLMEVVNQSSYSKDRKEQLKGGIVQGSVAASVNKATEKSTNKYKKTKQRPKYIIPLESKFTSSVKIIMGMFVAYSVFSNVYYIAFGYPDIYSLRAFDVFVEIVFLLDIIRNFFTEYLDTHTVEPVSDIKKIAYHYIFKSTFIFDCFAVFPFIYVIDWENHQELLLIKLLRIYKLQVDFVQEDKILELMQFFYQSKDREDIIDNNKFISNIIRINKRIIDTCVITYVLGCLWFWMVTRINLGEGVLTFVDKFSLREAEQSDKFVACIYFILTTLSTVGYGDYYPVSILEKIIGSLIMFCGVTFFSLLMEEFKGIILDWKGDYISDNERNLNKWMLLLRRFNYKGTPLKKDLREDLEQHFKYFWDNNRTSTLLEKKDYFDALPRDIKRRLMTEYLYEDIFKEKYFTNFFDNGEAMDPDFLYDISFGFQPRQFWPNEKGSDNDRFIMESEEYITEMYFILRGKFVIAKAIDYDDGSEFKNVAGNEIETFRKNDQDQKYLILKVNEKPTYIGEYYIFTYQRCNFDYIAISTVEGFALSQNFMQDVIFEKYPQLKNEMIAEAKWRYTQQIQKPLTKKRKTILEKFQKVIHQEKRADNLMKVDAQKVAEKKRLGRDMTEQLEANKAQLEQLNEKASQMFKHIEEIQQIIVQKCEDLDDKILVAEDKFREQLQEAIKNRKQLKRKLLQDKLGGQLKMPKMQSGAGHQVKDKMK